MNRGLVSNKKRTSFNVVGPLAHPDYFVDFMGVYQPETVVVVGNHDLCQKLVASTKGGTRVIHRIWSQDDGSLWRDHDPISYADYLIDQTPDDSIWKYLLNEPGAQDKDSIQRLTDFLLKATDRIVSRGHKVVTGNIGPATWEKSHIDNGWWDTYILEMAKLIAGGKALMGFHYYSFGFLPFGVGQTPWDWLIKPEMLQPSLWPTKQSLPISRLPDGSLPNYWHLLRSSWFDIRARELKAVGPLNKVITECWWDRMPDMVSHNPNPYDQWTQKWGKHGYGVMRGPRTYEDAWKGIWPDWTLGRALLEQCLWTEDVIPDNYIGFNIFAMTHGSEWDYPFGFDLEPVTEFFDLLRLRANTVPVEYTDLVEVTLHSTAAINVRKVRGLQGAITASILDGAKIAYSPSSIGMDQVDGYLWAYIKSPSTPSVVGWIALLLPEKQQFLTAQLPPIEPPPVIIPPNWMNQLDERTRKEVEFAIDYMKNYNHGTPGHLSYLTIAMLAELLGE
jgi:hypothetical protein